MTERRPTLSVEWSLPSERVEATYVLTNTTDTTILVFDRLYDTERSGKRTVSETLSYVAVSPRGLLTLGKLVPELPDDMDVESPEVPYGRIVEPGERLDGTAATSLPVEPHHAYATGADTALPERTAEAVFRLGYAPIGGDADLRRIETSAGVVFSAPHYRVAGHQIVLESRPVPMTLPVKRP